LNLKVYNIGINDDDNGTACRYHFTIVTGVWGRESYHTR